MKVKPVEFDDAMAEILGDYLVDTSELVGKEVAETARLIAKDVIANSPKRIPEYYKWWKIVKEKEYLQTKRIIWNEKHYQRVHLLENGHVGVDGDRVDGIPHVEPAYVKYALTMPQRIEKRLKKVSRK